MTKKERILMIQEIYKYLSPLNLIEIDFILDSYDFNSIEPLLSEHNYEEAAYDILKAESDLKILELYDHFNQDKDVLQVHKSPRRKGNIRIFISHLTSNKDFAESLKLELLDYNIDSFVAHNDVLPSREWQLEIEKNLTHCDVLIALLDVNFGESLWCDQEVGFAHGLNKFIIPIKLGINPYGFIGKFQWLSGINKSSKQLSDEIVELISDHESLYCQLGQNLVDVFSKSSSWNEANLNMMRLERLKRLDSIDLEKFKVACRENDQISGCFKISSTRIADFINKVNQI